ncbi:MAG: phosphotransferase family protein [Actinomycetota bacterium]|nr:phosphotransferase family protein [Actinomycetota bacterium]
MEGIDVERVTAWLVDHIEGVQAPFDFAFISGGRSNLTFGVTDAKGRHLVLRRPPISHVLATAHDMGREHRIITALAPTDVPVPAALGICTDVDVNEAPFYVMDFVDGLVLRSPDLAERHLTEEQRGAAANNLVDVLVAIHAVDPSSVGLGDLGRPEGYIERQLKRWYRQFQGSQEQATLAGAGRPVPEVHEVHDLLAARVPVQREVTIAHGDYRLDNTIVGFDAKVAAVLDWELCTLGDPLADLGTLMIYYPDSTELRAGRPPATTQLPGFPTRAELAERYATRSGRDISDLAYFTAFGHWRLACIIEGVYARYAAGAMGAEGVKSAEAFGGQVLHRAGLAKSILQGDGVA